MDNATYFSGVGVLFTDLYKSNTALKGLNNN